MFAAWLKAHVHLVWRAVFCLSSLPGLYLIGAFSTNRLGANPLETLTQTTGRSSLLLLTATLSVTPLRKGLSTFSRGMSLRYGKRVSDWNWLVRLRRMLGLWCFAYALVHAWVFLHFDQGGDFGSTWTEVQSKPYVMQGVLALLCLFPLAITSTKGMIRWLGKNWIRLHKLTYLVAVLGLLHFWSLTKAGVWKPLPDTLLLVFLLSYRLGLVSGLIRRWEGWDGRETPERPNVFLPPRPGDLLTSA